VFVDDDHEALECRVIAPDARVIRTAKPVVSSIEESSEHHGVWYAGEVPLGITV
jgi:hypothetical protein